MLKLYIWHGIFHTLVAAAHIALGLITGKHGKYHVTICIKLLLKIYLSVILDVFIFGEGAVIFRKNCLALSFVQKII